MIASCSQLCDDGLIRSNSQIINSRILTNLIFVTQTSNSKSNSTVTNKLKNPTLLERNNIEFISCGLTLVSS